MTHGSSASLILALTAVCFLSNAPARAQDPTPRQQIEALARNATCTRYDWRDRGPAKPAYMIGMALAFGRAVCQTDRSNNQIASAAQAKAGTAAGKADALTWYEDKFSALHMSNNTAGLDTLRHSYLLLLGLGMRESSGKYCEGRDLSASFTSADTAEAGLFQASWGANTKQKALKALYDEYAAGHRDCLREAFTEGIHCSASSAKNWGDPQEQGYKWQELTKSCPAFAVDYATVLIRVSGEKRASLVL
jgi:hypothetical protein